MEEIDDLLEDLFLEIEKNAIFTDGNTIEIDSGNLEEILREFIEENCGDNNT
jgi:hypothetical protein